MLVQLVRMLFGESYRGRGVRISHIVQELVSCPTLGNCRVIFV